MNWFMPALVSRRPDSGGGINEDEGTRRCSRSSKKRRNVSRIAAPSIGKASLPGGAGPAVRGLGVGGERGGELLLLLAHGLAPLGDRLGEQASYVHQPAAGLAGEVGRRDPAGLLAQEPHRHHCAGDPRAEAERDPEDPPHRYLFLPPKRLEAFFSPAPNATIFTSGPEAACSTRPEMRVTRPPISPADSSHPPPRASSRFVRSTEPLTSRRSGIVSSRIESTIIFVLSSTRNVLMSTTHMKITRSPQKADRTMRATSPPSSAAIMRSPRVRVRAGASYRGRRGRARPSTARLLALVRRLVVPPAREP